MSDKNRRSLPRRQGHPVEIELANPDNPRHRTRAWVVDRSAEGFCLVIEYAMPVGSVWLVRPAEAHPRRDWIEVEVRNSRPERNIWIVGCQFLEILSREELRQFG